MDDRALAEEPGLALYRLTLDRKLQLSLEALATEVISAQGERVQVAIVVADHRAGEVLAFLGWLCRLSGGCARGFCRYDPGAAEPRSTLKPLVYGLAFD